MTSKTDVTQILHGSLAGNRQAQEELFVLLYDELRTLAAAQMRSERGDHTLQPSALVHEAFMRLIAQDQVQYRGRDHFLAVAAMAMRRLLVDHARSRRAQKRGAGAGAATFDEDMLSSYDDPARLLAIDDALARLETQNPRQAKVVELRFFGGLTLDEAAAVLEVSRDTVKLDWRFARAWLFHELGPN